MGGWVCLKKPEVDDTREEKKAKKQLRKAENLQNRARARDSLVRDSAHLGKII